MKVKISTRVQFELHITYVLIAEADFSLPARCKLKNHCGNSRSLRQTTGENGYKTGNQCENICSILRVECSDVLLIVIYSRSEVREESLCATHFVHRFEQTSHSYRRKIAPDTNSR